MDLLRLYALADRAACLAIFDACTPRFFDLSEPPAFVSWLSAPPPGAETLAIERDGIVVACGGFYEGLGFEAVEVTPDGYGPGLDRVHMTHRP